MSEAPEASEEQHAPLDKEAAAALTWAAPDTSLQARAKELGVWPLDVSNARLLDLVHPRHWPDPTPPETPTE